MEHRTFLGSTFGAYRLALSVPDGMLLGLLLFFVIRLLFYRKRTFAAHDLWIGLLFVYIGALISLTVPLVYPGNWAPGTNVRYVLASIRFVPVEASLTIYRNCQLIGDMGPFYRLVGGNFAMLMPLALLIPLGWPRLKKRFVFLWGLLTSLLIEGIQLVMNLLCGRPVRTVEIDDVLLNVAGYLLVSAIFLLFRGLWRKLTQTK